MNIIEFKNKAIVQDKRNIFGEYNNNVSFIPNDLQKFYISCNPLDVEVSINENSIKFYPVNELANLQNDYKLTKNKFIFATCNGDPIYIMSNEVFTCCHGILNPKDEYIADSFEDFLDLID